ncbi:cytochrome c oxidase assembly protein COX15 homolog [Nephila pilipes]|uniref:Cytochrome c oxidase assembly protein COX15 homolog n=1 Tax=Nephila pilipes TaxID=299642 RepID=A0A8X6NGP8_NEPPI|nr:cytochrome c oxidase assembly protein COX15 homolog [Nephila pilipes]
MILTFVLKISSDQLRCFVDCIIGNSKQIVCVYVIPVSSSFLLRNTMTLLSLPVLLGPVKSLVSYPNHVLSRSFVSLSTRKCFNSIAKEFQNTVILKNNICFIGAFVAGIEAGLVYNTWPKMADRWIPSDIAAFSPKWRNITENPTTTQFNHRILGETVFCAVSGLWLYSRKLHLPPRAKMAVNCMFAMGIMQEIWTYR